MRFRTLLTLVVLIPLLAASIAAIAIMYSDADRRSTEMGVRLLAAATSQGGERIKSQSMRAAGLAQELVALADQTLPLDDSDRLVSALAGLLRANVGFAWLSYSNAEGDFTGAYRDVEGHICSNQSHIVAGKTQLVEYVLGRDGSRALLRKDPDSGYDPRNRPFYVSAARGRSVVWSDPYIFYNQSIPGISCSKALYSPSGELRGVFSVDYDLNGLSDFARQVAASPRSQMMVFTAERVLIAHSSVRVVPTSNQRGTGKLLTLADVEDAVTRAFEHGLRTIDLAAIPINTPHNVPLSVSGEPFIGCVMPVKLQDGPIQYVATVAPKYDFAPSAWQSSRFAILAATTALLIAMGAALILANRISAPLMALVRASERIGAGDLDVKFQLGSLYEFQHLSDALHAMLVNLRDWVRVRASINLAMEVQRRLLPAAAPRVAGFDIAGYSAYCDETGGDYYDFVLVDPLDPHRLVVVLGDVMGHGLPSALLMAGARGILRSGVSAHALPGSLLAHINKLLCRDTEGEGFMTMCVASFDLSTATCTWASAGHDPPIVLDAASNDFRELDGGGIPLGLYEDEEFSNYQFGPVTAGQVIVIGSDGVWETGSPNGDQFGKDRLKQIMATYAALSAEEIKNALIAALKDFRGNAPVRDDVTFVILKIVGTTREAIKA